MSKPLTIIDIARLSGVGKSTVSRVINRDPRVNPDTRAHVEAVIAEYGFAPSQSARTMRTQRSRLIGIIVSRLDSVSEHQVVRSLQDVFHQHGYGTMLMESELDAEKLAAHIHQLNQRHVDGLILFAFEHMPEKILQSWQSRLVLMARALPGYASVCYDDQGVIHNLLNQLYNEEKLKHIAFLGVNPNDTTTGAQRLQAYQQFCTEHQIVPMFRTGTLHVESGYQQVAELITPETEAILCATDSLALGAIKYLQEHRISMRLASIGHHPLLRFLFPEILSIDPGYQIAGTVAAHQLLDQLENSSSTQAIITPFPAGDIS